MEDFHETRIDGVDGETVGLFGVFDGKINMRSRSEETNHIVQISILGSELSANYLSQKRWLITDLSPQAMVELERRSSSSRTFSAT